MGCDSPAQHPYSVGNVWTDGCNLGRKGVYEEHIRIIRNKMSIA